jgi:hypothetical protein
MEESQSLEIALAGGGERALAELGRRLEIRVKAA